MKNRKILALMLGAIIASGSISQAAMQVYADLEESSFSESASISPEGMNLTKTSDLSGTILSRFSPTQLRDILEINISNLYASENRLIFEPVSDNEAKLALYGGNELDVNVPQTVIIDGHNYTVTSIGCQAFAVNHSIRSITLPDTITRIGASAFYNCDSLQVIELPYGITEIDRNAFYHCEKLQLIKLPESLAKIGESAFRFCESLRVIELPYGVTEIKENTFSLSSIEKINIPTSVTKIQRGAFRNSNIEKINIPASVTELGKGAFQIYRLEEINVEPGSQLTYDDIISACGEYSDQVRVTGIELPPRDMNPTKTINFFKTRTSRAHPHRFGIDHHNLYASENNLIFEPLANNEAKLIGYGGEQWRVNVPQTVIIDGHNYTVTSIGRHAFEDNMTLKSVTLPDTITEIGQNAFNGCDRLQSIKLPESLAKIGDSAFMFCGSLQVIELPKGVTEIQANAFMFSGIEKITIPASVIELGKNSFEIGALEEINVEPGSQLTYDDIMLACGVYSKQVRVTGIELPPR